MGKVLTMRGENTQHKDHDQLGLGIFQNDPFGPQNQWSWLLGERERLQREISRGQNSLEHSRRKQACRCCSLLIEVEQETEISAYSEAGLRSVPEHEEEGMERILVEWLVQLEQRLQTVTQDLEALAKDYRSVPAAPDESVLELLRAVG